MSTYIVCYVIKAESREHRKRGTLIPDTYTDHYSVFTEGEHGRLTKQQAKKYYKSLLKQDNVHTANLTKVIESTDY